MTDPATTAALDAVWSPEPAPVVPTPRARRYGPGIAGGPLPDPVRQRRNRLNRARGKSTSADLAAYLGGQNVEGMLWPHDCQGPTWRLQSKRDAVGRSPAMVRQLIERITPGDHLRGLYRVAPRQRLASGTVTLLVREAVAWWGWSLPDGRLLHAGEPLLELALPTFRDLVRGEAR